MLSKFIKLNQFNQLEWNKLIFQEPTLLKIIFLLLDIDFQIYKLKCCPFNILIEDDDLSSLLTYLPLLFHNL